MHVHGGFPPDLFGLCHGYSTPIFSIIVRGLSFRYRALGACIAFSYSVLSSSEYYHHKRSRSITRTTILRSSVNGPTSPRKWATEGFISSISKFPIPDSDITLIIETLDCLDLAALRSLLIVANASIAENLAVHGANANSMLFPFVYDLGDGVEIRLASSTDPQLGLTWGQLQTILRGLWIYHIEGGCNRVSFFDIWRLEDNNLASLLGWGYIRKPMKWTIERLPGNPISKRSSASSPTFALLNLSSSQSGYD